MTSINNKVIIYAQFVFRVSFVREEVCEDVCCVGSCDTDLQGMVGKET